MFGIRITFLPASNAANEPRAKALRLGDSGALGANSIRC